MSRRIKVLHVIQNLNYGGMERVLSDIVLRCDPDRFESHVLCLQYLGRFSAGLEKSATLHVAPPSSRVSMLRPRALAGKIAAIAPHVVHSHSGVWYKASYAARIAGVPRVVHTEHGRARPDPLAHRIVDAIGAQRSDFVVAVSQLLAGQLRDALRIPREKLTVIPNGVDVDVYRPHADTGRLRAELGLQDTTPIIGSIGRLEPIKGYDVMIEAFAVLREREDSRGAVLVIAGEGSQRPALLERIRHHRLEDRVFVLGWRDDVVDLHSAFAFFTMSSRSEGTSISLLEAMAGGLAPVVTDVGGNAAVLGDMLAHRLVPSDDPRALARAWASMLADPERRNEDSRGARARVIDAFGLDAMVRSYSRLYAQDLA